MIVAFTLTLNATSVCILGQRCLVNFITDVSDCLKFVSICGAALSLVRALAAIFRFVSIGDNCVGEKTG